MNVLKIQVCFLRQTNIDFFHDIRVFRVLHLHAIQSFKLFQSKIELLRFFTTLERIRIFLELCQLTIELIIFPTTFGLSNYFFMIFNLLNFYMKFESLSLFKIELLSLLKLNLAKVFQMINFISELLKFSMTFEFLNFSIIFELHFRTFSTDNRFFKICYDIWNFLSFF